jgi:hypothetical protein
MKIISKEALMARVQEALHWLAEPYDKQIDHLKEMKVWPCADELALELGDVAPILPEALERGEISREIELAVRQVSDKLDEMSGQENSHLWTPDALASRGHWEAVRSLALQALRQIKEDG